MTARPNNDGTGGFEEIVHQRDFTKMFAEFFRAHDRGVRFKVRHGSCLHHDIQFLSSLLHDGEVDLSLAKSIGKRLRITIRRDRWEKYVRTTGDERQLETITSVLTLSPVARMRFSLNSIPSAGYLEKSHSITSVQAIYTTDQDDRNLLISIAGSDWNMDVFLPDLGFQIVLRDERVSRRT